MNTFSPSNKVLEIEDHLKFSSLTLLPSILRVKMFFVLFLKTSQKETSLSPTITLSSIMNNRLPEMLLLHVAPVVALDIMSKLRER